MTGFKLPLLGSNQDSPDPESGVLPVTPRGSLVGVCPGEPEPFDYSLSSTLDQPRRDRRPRISCVGNLKNDGRLDYSRHSRLYLPARVLRPMTRPRAHRRAAT